MFGFLRKNKRNDIYLPVLRAERLLDRGKNRQCITAIRKTVGLSDAVFSRLYTYPIRQCAELVQSCPASEAHHHAYQGGLLAHILESCVTALKLREGVILPRGSTPEVAAKLTNLYTYAVFAATLLHDIAKPLTDQHVQVFCRKRQKLMDWQAPYQSITEIKGAKWMTIDFIGGRDYQHHQQSALIFLTRVLPKEGFACLVQDLAVYSEFLDAFSDKPQGAIYELMSQGDRTSVAHALGAANMSEFSNVRPLPQKIKTAVTFLINGGELSLNRPGASGWVNDKGVWLVSKRAVDAIREQLLKEGQDGIPTDNTRMFDVMSEGGLLTLNDGKAIWRCRVASDGWEPAGTFSLLLLPLDKIWNDTSKAPRFAGSITPTNEVEAALINTDDGADAAGAPGVTAPDAAAASAESAKKKKIWEMAMLSPAPDTAATSVSAVAGDGPRQIVGDESKVEGSSPGQNFLRWLESGINKETERVNTGGDGSVAQIHIIQEGVFIVSPAIFWIYAEKHRIPSWEELQKDFLGLKINLKTAKDENVFKVRWKGKKVTTINGIIIPHDKLTVERKLEVNERLTLVSRVAG